jgi:hypothetical protein
MTTPNAENQENSQQTSNKELNFRALEAKYQRQLEAERAARLEAERQYQEAAARKAPEEEEDTSEPYVDHKRLDKKMATFEKRLEAKIDQRAEEKARSMMDKERRDNWVRNNPDFYDVLQHADKFAEKDPELAETILTMPEGFERQKLVYRNIKALGLDKPEQKQPSIQDKIDANRKSPYYQPSGVGTAPYASQADFSQAGQKNAYSKMKELQQKLRI